MDRRERKYYLVNLSCVDYQYRLPHICMSLDSLKIHNADKHQEFSRYQQMFSIRNEEEEALLYELRKADSRDRYGASWEEI